MNKSILLKITIALFAIIFSFNAKAQSPTYQWAKQFSTTGGGAETKDMVTDNNGFVYVTGNLAGPMDFDPGAGVLSLSASGLSGAYVGKYDPNGNLVWAFKIDGAGNDQGRGIAVDNLGNVYVTGSIQNTVDFDPSAATVNLTATGIAFYLAKYTSSGTYVNAFTLVNVGTGYDVAVDGTNNVLVSGVFSGTADFDPGAGIFNMTDNVSTGGFIAKYTNALAFVWADGFIGSGSVTPLKIEFDAINKIYISGEFTATEDMDPGAGTANITTPGVVAGFFAKYNSDGSYRWAKIISSANVSSDSHAYDLSVDNNANVYITGSYKSQYVYDFDPSASVFNLGGSGTGFDCHLAKYDSAGVFNWALGISSGGANVNEATNVDVDISNNPIVVGYFTPGADFDPGAGTATLTANVGFDNGFCAKYNTSGNYVWAFSLVPSPAAGAWPFMQCDVSNTNYLFINGNFTQTIDFDPSASTASMFTSGSDIYIAKYEAGCTLAPSQPISISGTTTICSGSSNTYSVSAVAGATSYTWSLPGGWSGTSTTNSISTTASATSGNITVTANNACGNSSAQTLSVTVNTIPATPGTISGTTTICSGSSNTYSISAVAGATSYTWALPGGWSGTSTTNSISTTASATSGNITVTANNACGNSSAQTLSVTVNTIPATPGTISGLSSMCVGAGASTYSITSVVGATSYAWSLPIGWSGASTSNSISATPGSSGTISVTASNTCGTSAAQNLTVTINALPTIVYTQNPDTVCANAGNIALGSVTPLGGTFSGIAVTGANFNATTAGAGTFTITYTYTDANSCTNTASQNILVDLCTGLSNQILAESNFIVFPNPANELVTITTNENKGQLIIYNTLGAVLYSQQLSASQTMVDISAYQSGIYFIQLQTLNGMATKKIIKQ